MTDELPADAERALAAHEAVAPTDGDYAVTSTVFNATVTASGDEESGTRWTVTVTVPSLVAATSDPVGEAVADGWFQTLERRLADAPAATRADLELADLSVERRGLEVVVRFAYDWPDADRAVAIAKTLVEYVEGTYVEGIIPGYSYEEPVTNLLSQAETGGDATRGGTPL